MHARAQVVVRQAGVKTLGIDHRVGHDDLAWGHADQAVQRVAREVAVGDDVVGVPQREAHGLELAATPPAGQLFAVGEDQHLAAAQPPDAPGHQPFGQRAPGQHRGEAVARGQLQRAPGHAQVHRQRLRAQPVVTTQLQPVDAIRMPDVEVRVAIGIAVAAGGGRE